MTKQIVQYTVCEGLVAQTCNPTEAREQSQAQIQLKLHNKTPFKNKNKIKQRYIERIVTRVYTIVNDNHQGKAIRTSLKNGQSCLIPSCHFSKTTHH